MPSISHRWAEDTKGDDLAPGCQVRADVAEVHLKG